MPLYVLWLVSKAWHFYIPTLEQIVISMDWLFHDHPTLLCVTFNWCEWQLCSSGHVITKGNVDILSTIKCISLPFSSLTTCSALCRHWDSWSLFYSSNKWIKGYYSTYISNECVTSLWQYEFSAGPLRFAHFYYDFQIIVSLFSLKHLFLFTALLVCFSAAACSYFK